jgi:Cu(I)/Ag(I) efflux system membrane fusion protein
VAELMVRQGMTVSAGMSLARVNGLGTVWVEAAVPEAQSGPLLLGQGQPRRAAVARRGAARAQDQRHPAAGQRDTRTLRVRLELPNPGLRLREGMSLARFGFRAATEQLLLVPSEAVIRTGRRALAYVVDGFRALPAGRAGARPGDRRSAGGAQRPAGRAAGGGLGAVPDRLRGQPARLASRAAPELPLRRRGMAEHGAAAANAFTVRGVIEEVSPTELTLAHDPVPALKWPAMTMGFRLADPRAGGGTHAQTGRALHLRQTGRGLRDHRHRKGQAMIAKSPP